MATGEQISLPREEAAGYIRRQLSARPRGTVIVER
jgi:hypothetical protein